MADSAKLPLTVWLGPARSGKTTACLERLASDARARLIVQTEKHAANLRAVAGMPADDPGAGRIETFGHVLHRYSRVPPERSVRSAARRHLVAEAISAVDGPDSCFRRMNGALGFVAELCDLLREFKLSEIDPQALCDAAPAAGALLDPASLQKKAEEIARIYAEYQALLNAQALKDDEDRAILAVDTIRGLSERDLPSLVMVDGFYRFSRAWKSVLKALAARGCSVILTLPFEARRPTLFRSPARALEELRNEFDVSEHIMEPLSIPTVDRELWELERRLFGDDVNAPIDRIARRGIRILDCPNAYAEIEAVMRALRLARDREGVAWTDMLVIARNPAEYGSILTAVAERFDVPLVVQDSAPLAVHASVGALSALLRVFRQGWKRVDVLSFLRAGLGTGGRLEADFLRRRACRSAVRDGHLAWAGLAAELEDGPAAAFLKRMLEWYGRFAAMEAPASTFASQLRAAASEFGLSWDRAVTSGASAAEARNQEAAENALDVAETIARVWDNARHSPIEFDLWADMTLQAWAAATLPPAPGSDCVLVVDPYDARQRSPRAAAVIGLTERSFPRRAAEDPFFRDDERAALRAAGVSGLESRLDRADDERLLFYQSVTAPSEQLILSYPRTGVEGDFLPSFFLEDLRAALPGIPTIRFSAADVTPAVEFCADVRDAFLLRLSEIVDAAADEAGNDRAERILSAAEKDPEMLPVLGTCVRPPKPRLSDPSNASAYARPRRLRVTEIEQYNRCPFQHFAVNALSPQTISEGAGSSDRGSVYHRVLAAAFRRRRAAGQDSPPSEVELFEIADELAEGQRVDAAEYRKGLMRRFLSQALKEFAAREAGYAEAFHTRPAFFELAFGMDPHEVEEAVREYDASSTPKPLAISSEDGSTAVEVCGVIDRVDLFGSSPTALVMDYKTGSTPSYKSMMDGESLQMPLYLMALESVFGLNGAAAAYDSTREQSRRRIFRTDRAEMSRFGFKPGVDSAGDFIKPLNAEEYRTTVANTIAAVLRAAEKIHRADILPTPGEHCRTCDFSELCRTTADMSHDGEPFDLMRDDSDP